jgi:extracellular elastinolytic metalloproteinase
MKSSATALLLASSLISVLSKPIFSSSESSVRKSINFGPSFDYDVANDQSVALDAFNAKANDFSVGSLLCNGDSTCLGTALATSFVKALHPKLDFKLVDGYASSNTLVYHAHFVQVILHGKDKIAISNGNLNVNIDLATGNVVSYNDVAVKKDVGVAARRGIKEWATPKRLQQIVFGSPSIAIDSNTALTVNDPRHGLLAFLSGSADDVTTAFIASTSRSTLLASMPLSGTSTSMIVDNVPSALSPVTATLVYVRQGDHLALTWKYVVESNLNHYEAYVTADNAIEGQEDVVQAIDWVRDYRPTGGELGLNAFGLTALNVATTFKGPSSPSPPTAPTTPSPPRSTVSPSYRVFPWGT